LTTNVFFLRQLFKNGQVKYIHSKAAPEDRSESVQDMRNENNSGILDFWWI